jgi:predicted glycogen debranching enzyme
MSSRFDPRAEWLEADGLGGFASGTVGGVRTRRYHAILLSATTPPTGRVVLVNGIEAWVRAGGRDHPLSSQRYAPDVTHPDGAASIEDFAADPWPQWTYRLPDGAAIRQEIFVPRERAAVTLRWSVSDRRSDAPIELFVRPLMSGRDYHALHHENPEFCFEPAAIVRGLRWQAYDGVPEVRILFDGAYEHAPCWYRRFQYDEERARGLDFTEDLASPGVIRLEIDRGQEALVFTSGQACGDLLAAGETVTALVERIGRAERERRPGDRLLRARDAYFVRRGSGLTIVAGYPWFTDWGRDTFLALRGLAIAGDRLADARAILLEWSGHVDEGMLPNLFPDGSAHPEYNSVDASLWYVIAVADTLDALERAGTPLDAPDRRRLETAVDAILDGYFRGTRFGIRADADGLLACGEPGVQLTWMDAKVGDWVVTPRIGKPVEVQALWLNALAVGARRSRRWMQVFETGRASFSERFWNDAAGCLYDVVDVGHVRGALDGSIRPNQILAAGGLPLALVEGERTRRIVAAVESRLLTPLGLRSLAPDEPGYSPHYRGGVCERDGAYHQGTVWPWLLGPFVDAWLSAHGDTPVSRAEATRRFVDPLLAHLDQAGVGHVSEIADAEAPHTPGGCPFQAWSLGELLRIQKRLACGDAADRPGPIDGAIAPTSKRSTTNARLTMPARGKARATKRSAREGI